MPLLLDAGVLYALAAADDYWHVLVREFLKAERQSLLAPVTVIPKAAYTSCGNGSATQPIGIAPEATSSRTVKKADPSAPVP